MAIVIKKHPTKAELVFNHGGTDYFFNATENALYDGAGKKYAGTEAAPMIDSALDAIKNKSGEIADDAKGLLKGQLAALETAGGDAAKVKEFQKAFTLAGEIETKAGALTAVGGTGTRGIRTRIVTNPLSLDLASEASHAQLVQHLNFADLGKVGSAYEQLTKELAVSSPNADKIKKILIDHSDFANELTSSIQKSSSSAELIALNTKLAGIGVDLKGLPTEITKGITDGVAKATSTGNQIKAATENVARLTKDKTTTPDTLKAAQDRLNTLVSDFKTATSGEYGHKVLEKLEKNSTTKTMLDDVKKAQPTLASQIEAGLKKANTLTKAVEEGAAKGAWWKKSAEDLTKVAEKEGKSIEELGLLKKMNTKGKIAAGVGLAIIGYAIAKVVSKPEDKYKNQVLANNQGLAAGMQM